MKIKCFRISTSEDIIADVKFDDGKVFVLSHAIQMVMANTPKGMNLHMAPLVPTNPETEIRMDKCHVVYTYEPAKEIESKYQELVSGLILPSGLITG